MIRASHLKKSHQFHVMEYVQVAVVAKQLLVNDFVYHNKQWYHLEDKWRKCSEDLELHMFLSEYLSRYYGATRVAKELKTFPYRNRVIRVLSKLLVDSEFESKLDR